MTRGEFTSPLDTCILFGLHYGRYLNYCSFSRAKIFKREKKMDDSTQETESQSYVFPFLISLRVSDILFHFIYFVI